MKLKLFLIFASITSNFLFSQFKYKSDNYIDIVQTHKTIAILPTKAFIEIKSAIDANKIKEQERIESQNIQKSFALNLNKWMIAKEIEINIQDVDSTNAILSRNNININKTSYQDLATLLKVDAIITSKVTMANPLNNTEAFLSSLATGFFFSSKVTAADVSIIDKSSGRAIWNQTWQNSGIFSSTESLVKSMLNSISRRLPYKKVYKTKKS